MSIAQYNLKMRAATMVDLEDLLVWRNDPQSRMFSKNNDIVDVRSHTQWFKNVLIDRFAKIFLFVDAENDFKIGMVRLNFTPDFKSADLSINLNPKFRGRGFGKICLLHITEYIFLIREDCAEILALVCEDNLASIKIFEACGYEIISTKDRFRVFQFLPNS